MLILMINPPFIKNFSVLAHDERPDSAFFVEIRV